MIPEEVAQIANIIRNNYDSHEASEEEDFNYSIRVAWEIYNALKVCKCD